MSKTPITSERKVILALIALLLGWLLATFIPVNWSLDQPKAVNWSLNSIKSFVAENDEQVILLDGTGEKYLFSSDSETTTRIDADSSQNLENDESLISSQDSFIIYTEDQNASVLQPSAAEKPAALVNAKPVLEQISPKENLFASATSKDINEEQSSSELISIQKMENHFAVQSSELETAQGQLVLNSLRNAEIKRIEEPHDWINELKITEYSPPQFETVSPPAWSDEVGTVLPVKNIDENQLNQSSIGSLFESNKPQNDGHFVRVTSKDTNGAPDALAVEKTNFSELKSENAQSTNLMETSNNFSQQNLSIESNQSDNLPKNIPLELLDRPAIINANHFESLASDPSQDSSKKSLEAEESQSNDSSLSSESSETKSPLDSFPIKETSFTENQNDSSGQNHFSKTLASTDNKTVQAFLLKPQNDSNIIESEEKTDNNIRETQHIASQELEQNVLTILQPSNSVQNVPLPQPVKTAVLEKETSFEELKKRYSFSEKQIELFLLFNRNKLQNGIFPAATQLIIP
ncbi:MAG: hypothetical protein Q4C95_01705 [Planctomycetia bacterium]|nr:hypothetical protein [Planctomycetia bacterium]